MSGQRFGYGIGLTAAVVGLPGLLCLVYFRDSRYFTAPRLWAEEGTVYLQSALEMGSWRSLFVPHLGYYSLFNNLVAFVASRAGLEHAAAITTYSSLIIFVATASLPFLLPSKYWDSTWKKVLLTIFLLVMPTGEIWLNTINCQFFFAYGTFLILNSDVEPL
jgi:hypothetical protein